MKFPGVSLWQKRHVGMSTKRMMHTFSLRFANFFGVGTSINQDHIATIPYKFISTF